MQVSRFDIDGPLLFTPERFEDDRGHFSELFRQSVFQRETGQDFIFVQDNRSVSLRAGTLRGLHYQSPHFAQGKLVRVEAGEIDDVAVDFRAGSSSFGQHVKLRMTAETAQQFWVPPGFLHGFLTRADNTVVSYKLTEFYVPKHDKAIHHASADIDWGWEGDFVLSDKDKDAPAMGDVTSPFALEVKA